MLNLFRDEVLNRSQLDWLGPSRIAVPLSQKFVALAALVFSIGFVMVLFLGHYQQKEHLRGVLASSYPPLEVDAPQQGRIIKFLVKTGDPVSAGQPLVYIESGLLSPDAAKTYVLTAPHDGVVMSTGVNPGSTVLSGQRLFEIETPGSKLIAEFPMQGRDVGYLRPGDRLVLRYEDFPFQKFGLAYGVIQLLSLNHSAEPGTPPYLLTVSLEKDEVISAGRAIPLTAGLTVATDVPLEKRNLIHWIFHKAD